MRAGLGVRYKRNICVSLFRKATRKHYEVLDIADFTDSKTFFKRVKHLYQYTTVRPSLSTFVRSRNCCTFSIYLKTDQLFFIFQRRDQFYLHAKQMPWGNPKKLHVKSKSTQCNNRCNKQCTIFVMFFLIDLFGFKKIVKLPLLNVTFIFRFYIAIS